MPHDPSEEIGALVGELIAGAFSGASWLLGLTPEQRAQKRAAAKALADDRASREQQRQWYEAVARQQARGKAGFADEAEAVAALGGKGGRPSKLDGRKF